MYNYFISYSHIKENNVAFGCCDIESRRKIKSFEEIQQLVKGIEENYKLNQVVIINFRLFDK